MSAAITPAGAVFKRKDLIGLEDLSKEEITHLLDVADQFRELQYRTIKKVPTLRGKSVVMMFMEPSTRTKVSFDIAAKRLSADGYGISGSSSAVKKGETLLDTALNLAAMKPDIIVLRHKMCGSSKLLAEALPSVSIVNAGDGAHEHPTQGLLDMLTMRRKLGTLEGKLVTIVGDIRHSRVVRSNIWGLNKMGATVRVCGPRTLMPPGIEQMGVEVHDRLQPAIEDADVVMMLRIQRERLARGGHYFPSSREYARLFGLSRDKLRRWCKPDVTVMHPGPVNRGVELEPELADGEFSVIMDQVENGVAVRMAVLYLVLGGERAARKEGRG